MAQPEEERYTDLLRHLAAPSKVDPEGLVTSFREVKQPTSARSLPPQGLRLNEDRNRSSLTRATSGAVAGAALARPTR